MSLSAAVIDALLASGATRECIAAAIKADIAERDAIEAARLEAKREGNRERQRRYKERHNENNADNALPTLSSVTEHEPVSLDKSPPDPKKLNLSLCVNNSSPRVRGYHRLPEGWRPSRPLPLPLQAKVDQWPPGAFDDEVAAFKRWAANAEDKNGKGRKLDWDKALWNWLGRRHDERYGRTNGMGRPGASEDGLSSTARAAIAVFGRPPASH